MNSQGFHPLISLPTMITPKSTTLIAHIFTNDFCRPSSSGLMFTSISDHLPAFAIFGEAGFNPEIGTGDGQGASRASKDAPVVGHKKVWGTKWFIVVDGNSKGQNQRQA
jgi:hypothetical protein